MSALELTSDESGLLLEALLHNAFIQNYALYEHKLTAYKKTEVDVRRVIASAAVDAFLRLVDNTPLADKLASKRDAYIEKLAATRPELYEPLRVASGELGRPAFRGPINRIWAPARALALVCVGPSAGKLGEFVTDVHAQFMADAPRFAVEEMSWEKLVDRTVVLYCAVSDEMVATLLGRGDIEIAADSITVNGRTIEGENLVLIACQPHPLAADRGVLLYVAHDSANLIGINNIYHGPTDWVVARRITKTNFEPLARGVFAKPLAGDWMPASPT